MRLISHEEKPLLTSILSTSFIDNLNILALVKHDGRINKRIEALCRFCVEIAFAKKGAYLTANRKGGVLLFKNTATLPLLSKLKQYYKLGQYSVGWSRAIPMLKREALMKSHRKKHDHLYVWMMAIPEAEHIDTIKEIKEESFALSNKLKLPIIAETSSAQVKKIYVSRYGFEVYDEIRFEKEGYTLWYLERKPG